MRYGPHFDPTLDWVYNRADIDAAKVIWARDMGKRDNQELLDYFNDRQAWQVNVNVYPAVIERYGASGK